MSGLGPLGPLGPQHLSDEAVAACADGVLTGHARARAMRHVSECPECAEAVRVQRETAFVLRSAPAPDLPTDLLDRLRGLPAVTPVRSVPTVLMPDGSTMFPTSGSVLGGGTMAAFAPEADAPADARRRRGPFLAFAVATVLMGAAATAAALPDDTTPDGPGGDPTVTTVQHRTDGGVPAVPAVPVVLYGPARPAGN